MRLRNTAASCVLVLILAACGSGTTATPTAPLVGASTPTAAPGATSAPIVTNAPAVTPVVTPPAVATNLPLVTQGPVPSFASDPTLEAAFPTTVAGNPVTGVHTALLLDFFRALSVEPAKIDTFTQAMTALGIDAGAVVFGTATATVNEGTVGITAIRIPGHDANVLIQNYQVITSSGLPEGDTLTQEQSGGKTVTVQRDSGGYASSWLYANGDILWSVNTSSADEAAAVFAALP